MKPFPELRSATCHMGSYSVSCHLTQVNVSRLTGRYSIYLPWGMKGWGDLGVGYMLRWFNCTHPSSNRLTGNRTNGHSIENPVPYRHTSKPLCYWSDCRINILCFNCKLKLRQNAQYFLTLSSLHLPGLYSATALGRPLPQRIMRPFFVIDNDSCSRSQKSRPKARVGFLKRKSESPAIGLRFEWALKASSRVQVR